MFIRARERGATILDAVVGIALMLVVFVGIVGAFRLAVQAVGNNSARAGAIALANERLEYVRSLEYDDIGTIGGIPAGILAQEETIPLNGFTYTRRTFVSFEDDPVDGSIPVDTVPNDFKAVKTTVSWPSRQGTRSVTMIGRVSPPGVEQEIPGGVLQILVIDDDNQPIQNAIVHIVNETTASPVDTFSFTDADGLVTMIGAEPAADYKIAVSLDGYSSAQTYDADEVNTNPLPAHLAVALYQTTAAAFQIGPLSSASVRTYEPIQEEEWEDGLDSSSGLAFADGVAVSGGALRLAEDPEEGYAASGAARSNALAPEYLYGWKELSWDVSVPAGTEARLHAYTAGGALVPDADLPGNSAGFTSSPVSLSGLSTSTYPALAVGATLGTTDAGITPAIGAWRLAYDAGPIPLPDVEFAIRGEKMIGSGPDGPVYKYDETQTTDENGLWEDDAFEYDTYVLSIPADYDISSACPPLPFIVGAGVNAPIQLFLVPKTDHSLLVDVSSVEGGSIVGASARLQRTGYDETLTSDQCGQAFFPDLAASTESSSYTLTVTAPGFQGFSVSDVGVSGATQQPVLLNPL